MLGVGGGAGAGKTTLVAVLGRRGWSVLDLDGEARRLCRKGEDMWKALVREFGPSFLESNGNLDRKKMGWFAFKRRKNLLSLNRVTHSLLFREARKHIARTQGKGIVIDGAILYEGGFLPLLDMLIFVEVDPRERMKRMCKKCCTEREAQRRVNGQIFLPSLRRHSDIVLQNQGTREELKGITENILDIIEKRFLLSRAE